MKKIVVKGLLPLMMGTAIIGSGFSIWIFNDAKVEKDQTISKEITQLANVGELEVAGDMTIVFDQTEDKRPVESDAEAKGIYVKYATGADTTATYTPIGSTPNAAGEVDEGDGIYHQFTTVITVSTDLAAYMSIGYSDSTAKVTADDTKGTWTIVLAENVNDFDWTKVTLAYATDKEPTSMEAYKALNAAVTAATIKADYKVVVLGKKSN